MDDQSCHQRKQTLPKQLSWRWMTPADFEESMCSMASQENNQKSKNKTHVDDFKIFEMHFSGALVLKHRKTMLFLLKS